MNLRGFIGKMNHKTVVGVSYGAKWILFCAFYKYFGPNGPCSKPNSGSADAVRLLQAPKCPVFSTTCVVWQLDKENGAPLMLPHRLARTRNRPAAPQNLFPTFCLSRVLGRKVRLSF